MTDNTRHDVPAETWGQAKRRLADWMSEYILSSSMTDIRRSSHRVKIAWFLGCKETNTPIELEHLVDNATERATPMPSDEVETTYGHAYPGVDPRNFKPDAEVNTPEEMAAHAKALRSAEAGEPWLEATGGLHAAGEAKPWHTVGEWGWGTITHPAAPPTTVPEWVNYLEVHRGNIPEYEDSYGKWHCTLRGEKDHTGSFRMVTSGESAATWQGALQAAIAATGEGA